VEMPVSDDESGAALLSTFEAFPDQGLGFRVDG